MSGCASIYAPQNKPLDQVSPQQGYRSINQFGDVGNVAVYLTFSGGGTRAAALSYGVLQELRDTRIGATDTPVRLLDEVDQISSVSGGSFTAAYYGLFGDEIFTRYEQDFLRQSVQSSLIRKALSPSQWYRSLFTGFDRTELAIDYYDTQVFRGKTFADMRQHPLITINATDVSVGNRFAFHQEYFDLICSDLDKIKVARAVTASSAVPVLFPSIVLKNYAGKCDLSQSPIGPLLSQKAEKSYREQRLVEDFSTYLDREKRPYIHLVDGGISDNLGVRALLDRVELLKLKHLDREKPPSNILIIIVDAKVKPARSIDMSAEKPSISTMVDAVSSVQIDRYTEESTALVTDTINKIKQQSPDLAEKTRFHVVKVRLVSEKRKQLTDYLNSLPTSLELSNEEIDALILSGRTLLRESPEFRAFLEEPAIQGKTLTSNEQTPPACKGLDSLSCFLKNITKSKSD